MKRPVKILTLDTETYNGLLGELKRIAVYDGEKVYYGYTFEDVEKILLNYDLMGFNVHCYIHNIEFDARKIPDIFSKERIKWKNSLCINHKLATISCKKYVFHDSFKLLPMALKKLSESFDLEHGKLDLWEEVQKKYSGWHFKNIVDFLDNCSVQDPLYLEYLGYDVMSLYELIYKLIDLTGIQEYDFVKKVSTASISRHLFEHGFKGEFFKDENEGKTDFDILCEFNWEENQEVEEFIRASYCGGRTEVFKPRLWEHGFHYDVNSLYPFVMSDGKALYPVGKPLYYTDGEIAQKFYNEWKKDKVGLGFLYCKVFVPKQHIPPLPVKKGKLCFPCGEFDGVWTYEELDYSEQECGVKILEYYEVCHFEKTYPVFKRFIECFYQLKDKGKKEKNIALTTFAKLIMNVGYGYTGMRRDDKTALDSIEKITDYDNISNICEDLGFIEIPNEVHSKYIQVQVASYVTSRARLVLLKGLKHIEKKGGNVYYCDTDSIVSDVPMDASFIDKYKLGYWDCEADNISNAIFLKPKVYAEVIGGEVNKKFKGVSRDTVKDYDFEYYKMLYKLFEEKKEDEIVVEKNKLVMRSIMYMHKKNLDYDYVEYRDKKMNLKNKDKRLMNYEKNYTEPLFFKSIEDFDSFDFYDKEYSMYLGGTI